MTDFIFFISCLLLTSVARRISILSLDKFTHLSLLTRLILDNNDGVSELNKQMNELKRASQSPALFNYKS